MDYINRDSFNGVTKRYIGALFGSYLGSVLEERIALGTNAFMVEVSCDNALRLTEQLEKENFQVSKIKSDNNEKTILMITGARKKTSKIVKIIRNVDNKAFILSEKVKIPL